MIRRLPLWVKIGGGALALIAGWVNAVGFLGFAHQAVSHLTGSASLLGVSVARGELTNAGHLVLVILCFVIGAMLSGWIVRDATLHLGRRYGAALAIESALLFAATEALTRGSTNGHLWASAACGLQNALASTFSGAVIRTTHVTGMLTDIGIILGQGLRRMPMDGHRLRLYAMLVGGFIAGGALGAATYGRWQFASLLIPATLTAALSIAYWLLWWRRRGDRHHDQDQ